MKQSAQTRTHANAHNLQLADVLEAVLPPPGFIAPGAGCTLTISLTPKVGDSHWRQPLVWCRTYAML